ncbi:MAG: DNA adenine methylase [Planctomycetota bacterium]
MRYIGNKSKLGDFIKESFLQINPEGKTVADIFAGTAAVSLLFKKMGYKLITNDIMEYSHAAQVSLVKVCSKPKFKNLIDKLHPAGNQFKSTPLEKVISYLNNLKPIHGFITNHYSPAGKRNFFSIENAGIIDSVRTELQHWLANKLVTDDEYYLCLSSLLNAADSVANTAGTYGAFLKNRGTRYEKKLVIRIPEIYSYGRCKHKCYCEDAFSLLSNGSFNNFDILYLDPPYNRRDYSKNYHVLEIIARGWFDKVPEPYGKSGLVKDIPASPFCRKESCTGALREIIKKSIENCGAKHLFLSYNSEGLIPSADIESVLLEYGRPESYHRFERMYKRYCSDSVSEKRKYSGNKVIEYLYYVKVK